MESRAKFLGHPLHQMLVVFPLGLLSSTSAFDIVALVSGSGRMADVAYWMIVAGVILGVPAAVAGAIDWLAIPNGTRAKRIGALHGAGNIIIMVLFSVSWYLRAANPFEPSLPAVALSLSGVALLLFTAWLGGELVDRLGVGVDDGASLNAPNSILYPKAH